MDRPLGDYTRARGHASAAAVALKRQRFGSNSLHIPIPRFQDIFFKQMLGPVPVFQVSRSRRLGVAVTALAPATRDETPWTHQGGAQRHSSSNRNVWDDNNVTLASIRVYESDSSI